jgi:hypothetical protein
MKDVMTGLERLQYVATLIKDAKDVMPASYGIYIQHDEIEEEVRGDFDLILEKIKEEYGVITYTEFNDQIIGADGTEHFKCDYSVDTLAGYDEFYERLTQNSKNLPKPTVFTGTPTLIYNKDRAEISYTNKLVSLRPVHSMQAFLFGKLCEANGGHVETSTLLSDYAFMMNEQEKSERAFYDAYLNVNTKIKNNFDLDNAVVYHGEQFWLNPELTIYDSLHSH